MQRGGGSNNCPYVRGILQLVAIDAKDSGLGQEERLVPRRLMDDGHCATGGLDVRQVNKSVLGATVDGITAAEQMMPDFRRLSFQKPRRDDDADKSLRSRLQQF